jgi:hypothetical protein
LTIASNIFALTSVHDIELTRVDETNTLKSNFSGALGRNHSGLCIDQERIEETVSLLIICVVNPVQGNLTNEDVRLSELRQFHFDSLCVNYFQVGIYLVTFTVSEARTRLSTLLIRTCKVLTCKCNFLSICGLDRTETRGNLTNNRCLVVLVARLDTWVRVDHTHPVNVVSADLDDTLGALGLWLSHKVNVIICELVSLHNLSVKHFVGVRHNHANPHSIRCLRVVWVSERLWFEIFKAYTQDFYMSTTGRWS